MALGYAFSPRVDDRHPPVELADFFGSSAQVMAALIVALALFQSGSSAAAGHGARQFLSLALFPLLGVGLAAALAGLIRSLPTCLYAWMFGVVVGAGATALLATVLVGVANIHAQRRQGIREITDELDPRRDAED
jgi:hypothetical protein